MFFELTNEQRKCFGLRPAEKHWQAITAKPAPRGNRKTLIYVDGSIVRKQICCGKNYFIECDMEEQLTEDLKYLLPKTSKGKPVPLSAAALEKRKAIGMRLAYSNGSVSLCNCTSLCDYYHSYYDPLEISTLEDFAAWVAQWCEETTPEDIEDVARFAQQKRMRIKFKEGDVFRFKLNRRQYGYGRILLDYSKMRRNKEPFWDCLMLQPLVCSAYRILTDRKDVPIQELEGLPSLPSTFIGDNSIFYGEYEIIGNIPLRDQEDYPIMYGFGSIAENYGVILQCGRKHCLRREERPLSIQFFNNSIGFLMNTEFSILQQCIAENSNMAYWNQSRRGFVEHDLRNPKFRKELEEICAQLEISPSQLGQ